MNSNDSACTGVANERQMVIERTIGIRDCDFTESPEDSLVIA